MHQGLPYSSDGLSFSQHGACGPPGTSCSTFSSSSGKTPMTMDLTCDDMHMLLILIKLYSRRKGNRIKMGATVLFYIFLG
jgi:hypothetical protein